MTDLRQMRSADFALLVAELRQHLDNIEQHWKHARANLHDWTRLPYPGSGTGRRPSGVVSDPTVAAAISMEGHDQFVAWDAELGRRLRGALPDLRRAAELTLSTINVTALPGAEGCAICAAVKLPAGKHACSARCRERDHEHEDAWQEIYVRRPLPGEEDPSKTTGLCSFCAEFIARYGEVPSLDISIYHLDHLGSRVPPTLIKAHHAEAYAARFKAERASQRGAA